MYLLLSPNLNIVDATDAFLQNTLTSRENVKGKYVFSIFPNNPATPNVESDKQVLQSLHHVLKYKQQHMIPIIRYDILLPSEKGGGFEERYWSTTNVPVLNEQGQVQYIIHETRDITDQVLSEAIRQQSQLRLNLLSNALKAVAWEYDILNNKMTWGAGLQELFGYTPEDMGPGGESWDARVHPEDFEAVQQSIEEAIRQRQTTWTGEYRFRKADGTYAYILDQGYTVYDNQGKPVRTTGSIIDITQGKDTEKALKESDARFHHLLDILPHMAWTSTPHGKILFFNDNWYSYTGMKPGQTEGWISVIHPEDSATVLTSWHNAVASGQSFEIEYRIRNYYDGTYRWFLERGVPMHDAQGNITLWMGTYTDIEEQKQSLENSTREDQRLENMLRLSPVHLCVFHGPDHTCRYITPGVYKIFGNRNYIGKPARELWPELEPLGFFDLLEEVYTKGKTVHINEFKTQVDEQLDGMPKDAYFNFKYQPMLDSENQIEGIMVSAIEVTNLVKARQRAEALAKSAS
jgi:PAS domain S-box-containing protein